MSTRVKNLIAIAIVVAQYHALAAVSVFENDPDGWAVAAQLGGALEVGTVDFESITGSVSTPIAGDEFAGFAAGPMFVSIDGLGVFVGNPALGQIPNPPSGVNMLGPACTPSCQGIIRVTFATPVLAIGATFVDVEADFATTGFALTLDAAQPDSSFSSSQGSGAFSFLGIVSTSPFTAVDIHFSTGENVDGTLLDDLTYSFCSASADFDADNVVDNSDNCLLVANANQIDADGDGIGNACDADLNNDWGTNAVDLGLFRSVFFSNDANADFNGDGIVNVVDLGLLRLRFFDPPGPSCVLPLGTTNRNGRTQIQ